MALTTPTSEDKLPASPYTAARLRTPVMMLVLPRNWVGSLPILSEPTVMDSSSLPSHDPCWFNIPTLTRRQTVGAKRDSYDDEGLGIIGRRPASDNKGGD